MNLTTADVCELVGVPQRTLADWVKSGLVEPVVRGRPGRGYSDEFTTMQLVGLAVALEQYRSEQGCGLSYVGAVTESFSSITVRRLRGMFAKGQTHFVCIAGNGPILQCKAYKWINVKPIFDEIMSGVLEKASTSRETSRLRA